MSKDVDERGNLTCIARGMGLPFEPVRVFWTYTVPGNTLRKGHAYKHQNELIISLNGAFDVVVASPQNELTRFRLNRPDARLLVPPMNWRWMEGFSTNGVG